MDFEILKFSYNWNNKLACNVFTTIRLYNPKIYYVGKKVRVFLKEDHIKDAEIIDIRKIRFKNINRFIAGIDTGYSEEECKDILKKMYPKADWQTQIVLFILLKTVKHEKRIDESDDAAAGEAK